MLINPTATANPYFPPQSLFQPATSTPPQEALKLTDSQFIVRELKTLISGLMRDVFTALASLSFVPTPSTTTPPADTPAAPTDGTAGLTGGFFWKPTSSTDKKLVVLLPARVDASMVSLYRALPPTHENFIEHGNRDGVEADGRPLFRFQKQGRAYPAGLYVVVKTTSGETLTQQIEATSRQFKL
jgi:hypothetical protein